MYPYTYIHRTRFTHAYLGCVEVPPVLGQVHAIGRCSTPPTQTKRNHIDVT